MKNFKTGKFLAAAAAGAMMLTGVAAQADLLTFTPGTAEGAPGTGSGALDTGFVDLSAGGSFVIEQMNWTAVNNDFSNTWNVVQDGDDTSKFEETFTFLLQSVGPDAGFFGNAGNSLGGDNTFTFVTMVGYLTGSYGPGFDPANDDAVDTNLIYDAGGKFTMYFHSDGVATNCAVDSVVCGGTQIAIFDVLAGTATKQANGDNTDLHWDLELRNDDIGNPNLAFTDENGSPFDPAAQIVLAVTDQVTVASIVAAPTIVFDSFTGKDGGKTFFEVNSVPEPGMLGLLGIGLLGLGIAVNRRKQRG